MVDIVAYLRKAVFAELGVYLRRHVERKVAHGPAREQAAQIDRNQHLDGPAQPAEGHLLGLQAEYSLHHRRRQELCDRRVILVRLFAHGVGIEHECRQMHKAVRLRLALEGIGCGLLAARGVGAAVLEEAVLQLLRRRLLEPAEYAVFSRDADAVLARQVLGDEGLEEYHPARAVGERVEYLNGYAVFIGDHAEGALAYLLMRHVRKGIGLLALYLRHLRHALEVEPEQPAPQPHADGREAAQRDVERRAQHLLVDRFRECCGQAKDIAPLLAPRGGVYLCCVIQPQPLLLLLRGHDLCEELVHILKVRHVLIEHIEHIGVPALGRYDHLA